MDEKYWLGELERINDGLDYGELKQNENEEMLANVKVLYGDKDYSHVERVYKKICQTFKDPIKEEIAILHGLVDDEVMTADEVLDRYGEFAERMVSHMTKGDKTNEGYYGLFAQKSILLNVKIYEVLDMLEHCYSEEYAREVEEHFLPILKSKEVYAAEYELIKAAIETCK